MKGNRCNLKTKPLPGHSKIVNETNEDSDSFHFLMQMDDIIVKEIHFYTHQKSILGYQTFLLHHNQVITKGLIIDIPDKYHDDLLNLGCSEKELEEEKLGAFYKSITFNDEVTIYTSNNLTKEYPFVVEKAIYRLDVNKAEYIFKVKVINSVYKNNATVPNIFSMYLCSSENKGLKVLQSNKDCVETFVDKVPNKNQQICGFVCKFFISKPKNSINTIEHLAPILSLKPSSFNIKVGTNFESEKNDKKEDEIVKDDDDLEMGNLFF